MNYRWLGHNWVREIDPNTFEPQYRCSWCGESDQYMKHTFCTMAYYYVTRKIEYERYESEKEGIEYDHAWIYKIDDNTGPSYKCEKCGYALSPNRQGNLNESYAYLIPCKKRKNV
jgi:predicted RNA-binding Zn-ribbon protein involved in translation (DUF1610 family)